MPQTTAGTGADTGTGVRERVAGRPQALVLLIGSCLPILGAILIAPVLPQLQDAFAGTPGVAALAPVALSIPSLAVGLLALVAGRVVDRVGRTRLLLAALPLYVVAGTAPLWLDSLPAIVISRALIGVAEAAIMTCCVTLIGDYWSGAERDRYLALQTVVTSFSAVVFLLLGGALGANGWRTPFWAYLSGIVFLPLMAKLLWQPRAVRPAAEESGGALSAVPWRSLAPLLGLTLVGAVVFYAVQVELSYVLDDMGVGSAGIGIAAALANLAVMGAAASFTRLAKGNAGPAIVAGFVLGGAGLLVIAVAGTPVLVTVGAVVSGAGGGLLLPSLLVGTTSRLGYEQRGRGTGAWTSAFFLGQFICPLLVVGLTSATGELTRALAVVGVAGVVLGGIAFLVVGRSAVPTGAALPVSLGDGLAAPAAPVLD